MNNEVYVNIRDSTLSILTIALEKIHNKVVIQKGAIYDIAVLNVIQVFLEEFKVCLRALLARPASGSV